MIRAHTACFSLFLPPFIHPSALLILIITSLFIFSITIFVNTAYSFACPSVLPSLSSLSLSLWHISGGHSRSNSGSSESSIPNLARSLLLVDQLIDL